MTRPTSHAGYDRWVTSLWPINIGLLGTQKLSLVICVAVQWEDAFVSLFQAYSHGLCRDFYYQTKDFTVHFT